MLNRGLDDGADTENRTQDLTLTKGALYQLSHISIYKMPGSDLLSRRRTLHYHGRGRVSLLCSEWEQVVPRRHCRQAKGVQPGSRLECVFNWSWELVLQGPEPAASRCSPGLCGQDIRIISAGKLHPSRGFHIRPINVVVSNVPYRLEAGDDSSRGLLPA